MSGVSLLKKRSRSREPQQESQTKFREYLDNIRTTYVLGDADIPDPVAVEAEIRARFSARLRAATNAEKDNLLDICFEGFAERWCGTDTLSDTAFWYASILWSLHFDDQRVEILWHRGAAPYILKLLAHGNVVLVDAFLKWIVQHNFEADDATNLCLRIHHLGALLYTQATVSEMVRAYALRCIRMGLRPVHLWRAFRNHEVASPEYTNFAMAMSKTALSADLVQEMDDLATAIDEDTSYVLK